ncbi:MAG: peroxide stress protein YaaA [Lewinellaceae bacterium]|nr:peroxide stress protein YaaA [Lewinellaceae bacterium]
MLILLSPSKTMLFDKELIENTSTPEFNEKAIVINKTLQKYSTRQLEKMMDISPKLASQTHEHIHQFSDPDHEESNSIYAYRGDVYSGLDALSFNHEDILYAQNHIRILSAYYGILKPLDRISPYRLEMKTKLKIGKTKDLYTYWKPLITKSIQESLRVNSYGYIINLASQEYAKVVDFAKTNAQMIDVQFYEEVAQDKLKMVSVFSKRPRGLFAKWMIINKISDIADFVNFSEDGYAFSPAHSNSSQWIFIRKHL